jgi:hypothetical protein
MFQQRLHYFFTSVAAGAPTADVAAAGADAAAGATTGATGAAVSAAFWPQADNARVSRAATSAIRFILVSLES